MATTSDQELIRQSRGGSVEAFGLLVERHQDRLCGALFRLLGSFEDARDAAQDAFVQAFQKLDGFQGHSAFSTWLFRIAVNAAFTRKRRARRERPACTSDEEGGAFDPLDGRPDADPSHFLLRSETRRLVRDALETLREDFRTALVLKEMEGFSYEEIAEITAVPIGTVRSRIHRARQELREKLRLSLKQDI